MLFLSATRFHMEQDAWKNDQYFQQSKILLLILLICHIISLRASLSSDDKVFLNVYFGYINIALEH